MVTAGEDRWLHHEITKVTKGETWQRFHTDTPRSPCFLSALRTGLVGLPEDWSYRWL